MIVLKRFTIETNLTVDEVYAEIERLTAQSAWSRRENVTPYHHFRLSQIVSKRLLLVVVHDGQIYDDAVHIEVSLHRMSTIISVVFLTLFFVANSLWVNHLLFSPILTDNFGGKVFMLLVPFVLLGVVAIIQLRDGIKVAEKLLCSMLSLPRPEGHV